MLVALACAAASARRLWFAANATSLHPEEVLRALDAGRTLADLRAVVARDDRADWERDLLIALSAGSPEARSALVNEQLTELDHRQQRWARVPRVCASISMSADFLLATLVLRKGLTLAADTATETGELVVRGLVGEALTVVALGMVGTAFCLAVQGQAKRMVQERAKAADRLVERLEEHVARGASASRGAAP